MKIFLYLIRVVAWVQCLGVTNPLESTHVDPENLNVYPENSNVHPEGYQEVRGFIDISRENGEYFSSIEIEFNRIPAKEFVVESKAKIGRVIDGIEVLWEASAPGDYCNRVLLFYHLYTPDLVTINRVESNEFDFELFGKRNGVWVKFSEREFLERMDKNRLIEYVLNVVDPTKEFTNVVNTYMQGIYAKVMRPRIGFKAVALEDENDIWFQVPQTGFSVVTLFNRYEFRDLLYVCGYGTEYQISYYFFGKSNKGWESLSLKDFSKEFEKMAEGVPIDPNAAIPPSVIAVLIISLLLI